MTILRLGLAAAAALSPSLAARFGERLFLAPRRRALSPREHEVLSSGEPFVVPFRGERLRGWRCGSGPAVLLVHGWGGCSGAWATFVPALSAAGFQAVAFDAPAHGASTGRLASGACFAAAAAELAARVSARAAIGHSLGAAALGWAMAGGLRLEAAVLLAPPRGAGEPFRAFCEALGLGEEVRRAMRARMRRRFGLAPEDFDLLRLPPPATPLLLVHDLRDRGVPLDEARAIAAAWPGTELLVTAGLGHRGLLRDAAVVGQATRFVERVLGPTACAGTA